MLSFKSLTGLFEKYFKGFRSSATSNLFINQELSQDFQDNRPYWLILKCTKCNKKAIPIISQEMINPASRFCKHCGSEKYYIEKKHDIEHLDTIYAIYSKDVSDVRKAMVRYNCVQRDRRTGNSQLTRQLQIPAANTTSRIFEASQQITL